MDNLADKIHSEMLHEIAGMSVFILFSGIHRWFRDYQELKIFTSERSYHYGIINTTDSTAYTISHEVAKVINILRYNGTNVIAICCDNKRTNAKAFNGKDGSAQDNSQSHIICQSCTAHTSSLAKSDIFSDSGFYDFVAHCIKY